MNVVGSPPGHLRVNATGIVADHPANRAPLMRGRVGPERELKRFRRLFELMVNNTWLRPGKVSARVDAADAVHVLGKIDDDCDVAALSGEAGACASGSNRRAKCPANGKRLENILDASRNHHADGDLPVI